MFMEPKESINGGKTIQIEMEQIEDIWEYNWF